MKKIISCIFLLMTILGFSQNTEYLYSIKFLKCCNEPTHHDPEWKLKSLNGEIYSPKNNLISVPDSGEYLFISSTYNNQPISIFIEKNNDIDTIYLKCLEIDHTDQVLVENTKQTDPIYITCSGKVNSIYKEYFLDGKLRIIGNFNQGVLIDSLVEFYYSGSIKSKVLKKKTTYEHWYFYPNGKIEKRSRYDLKKRKRYQFFEYNKQGEIVTEIDYSKKYGFRYYETGTIKTSNPGRPYENYFIVNDSVIYQCKNEIETIFYSNGNKKMEFSSSPMFWMDRFRRKRRELKKDYKLYVYYDSSQIQKFQKITFWSSKEISIYNGGLSKLGIADAYSVSYFTDGKSWLTIYPIVYDGDSEKEVVLYEMYDRSQNQPHFKKLKPQEMEKYLIDKNLKMKSW